MKVQIKRLDGERKPVDIADSSTAEQLKQEISEKMGIDKAQLRLIFKGQPLLDDKSIAEQGVKEGDMIHVILHLSGG